jgi:hypothetical protein
MNLFGKHSNDIELSVSKLPNDKVWRVGLATDCAKGNS